MFDIFNAMDKIEKENPNFFPQPQQENEQNESLQNESLLEEEEEETVTLEQYNELKTQFNSLSSQLDELTKLLKEREENQNEN